MTTIIPASCRRLLLCRRCLKLRMRQFGIPVTPGTEFPASHHLLVARIGAARRKWAKAFGGTDTVKNHGHCQLVSRRNRLVPELGFQAGATPNMRDKPVAHFHPAQPLSVHKDCGNHPPCTLPLSKYVVGKRSDIVHCVAELDHGIVYSHRQITFDACELFSNLPKLSEEDGHSLQHIS